MSNLDRIAQITVGTGAAGVQIPSFSKILIASFHTRWLDRVRSYSSPSGWVADGGLVSDPEYIALTSAFAQNPAPEQVKIGRRVLAPDLQIDITPTAQNSTVYELELTGPAGLTDTISVTSDVSATVAEILGLLVTEINNAALGIVATNQTTFLRLKAASPGLWFGAKVSNLALLAAQTTHADPGIATDLAAIQLADSDWYGFTLTTQGKAETIAAATWSEGNKKFYVQDTSDVDVLTAGGGNVLLTIKAANQFRTKGVWRKDSRKFTALGWLARVFGFNPGATTFQFHTVAGADTETLTETQLNNLTGSDGVSGARAGVQISFGGVGAMYGSVVAGGEWMDVIRDRDWFEARLQQRDAQAKLNASAAGIKIPYTDSGAQILAAEVRGQYDEGVASGFLDGDSALILNVPKVATMSPTNRQNRKYGPITFGARIAGAIHLTNITGSVTP